MDKGHGDPAARRSLLDLPDIDLPCPSPWYYRTAGTVRVAQSAISALLRFFPYSVPLRPAALYRTAAAWRGVTRPVLLQSASANANR
jgi:hypothetical protein